MRSTRCVRAMARLSPPTPSPDAQLTPFLIHPIDLGVKQIRTTSS